VRNDQFAQVTLNRPAYHGMMLQYGCRIDNGIARLACQGGIVFGEKIENTLKIVKCPAGKPNDRHAYFALLRSGAVSTGLGRFAALPAARVRI